MASKAPAKKTVEEKYEFMTAVDSIILKDWAAGSRESVPCAEFLMRSGDKPVVDIETIEYPPALMKIVDEPIVNALDHLVRTRFLSNATGAMSKLEVTMSSDGEISVWNDGPGIEIEIHQVASEKLGQTTWTPSFIFGELFQGSNKQSTSIIGGTNGLGAKITNCFSTEFKIATLHDGRYFVQTWNNNMKIKNPPQIQNFKTMQAISPDTGEPLAKLSARQCLLPAKARKSEFTQLTFMPDYARFKYSNFDDLRAMIRMRLHFAAVYAKHIFPKSQISFVDGANKEDISTDFPKLAEMLFPGCKIVTTKTSLAHTSEMKTKPLTTTEYEWDVAFAVGAARDISAISIVNGIIVRGGRHHAYLLDKVVDGVKARLSKKTGNKDLKIKNAQILANINLLVLAKIPKPSWSGQRKDHLDIPLSRLKIHQIDPKIISRVAEEIEPLLIDNVIDKTERRTKIDYDKFTDAHRAGTSESQKCLLIAVEGDSAMGQICIGINETLNWKYYGAVSLGGVIINARKEVKRLITKQGERVVKSPKLQNNVFMKALTQILGLNYAYAYDPASPTYQREIASLRYGGIVACVDQDLDGKGNILGLLLNIFDLFWPKLLERGFVRWFATPIIRAYPKSGGKVEIFYNSADYKRFAATTDQSKYLIRYYKGLGTHSRRETAHMFRDFEKNTFRYCVDEKSREIFEIYFGGDADLRKHELSQPERIMDDEKILEQFKARAISCSDHLQFESYAYQKDNLERKLNHIVDGQNQAGRKILDGILKKMRGKEIYKVPDIGGFISSNESYHHGETSLSSSIIGRGFVACGGYQFPIVVPKSNFGTRIGGGSDAVQPRYAHAAINPITEMIFPREDYWLYEFNFDDGKRCEPKYFAPIIPLVICESIEVPAHGWKLKLWAREAKAVIDTTIRVVKADSWELGVKARLPPADYAESPHRWTGTFKEIGGQMYSIGRYEFVTDIRDSNFVRNNPAVTGPIEKRYDMLVIRELPLRVWTENYVKQIKKKMEAHKWILGLLDSKKDIGVEIKIFLKPGSADILAEYSNDDFDGVEEFFCLRSKMDSHINLMHIDGSVKSLDTYGKVYEYWYPIRREYYGKRVRRQAILLDLRIRQLQNVIRYIDAEQVMNNKRLDEMIAHLEAEKYDKFNSGLLENPEFTPNDELEDAILRGAGANYMYLLGLSDAKKSKEKVDEMRKRLKQLQDEQQREMKIRRAEKFPGAAQWLDELAALRKKFIEGASTCWEFEDAGDKYVF